MAKGTGNINKAKKLVSSLYSYKQYFSSLEDKEQEILIDFVSDRYLIYDYAINDFRYTFSFDEHSKVIKIDDSHFIDYLGKISSRAEDLYNEIIRIFP